MSPNSSRRKLITLLLTFFFVTSLFLPFANQASSARTVKTNRSAQQQANSPHREGELLVRFRAGVSKRDKDGIIATHGVRKKKALQGESDIETFELPTGQDARTVALRMLLNPQVEFAEPNFLIAEDDVIPNDAQFGEQWALRNTGQNGAQFGSDINAAGAWATTTGSTSTVIAVIDSGIDFTHPDLANSRWANPYPSSSGDPARLGLR